MAELIVIQNSDNISPINTANVDDIPPSPAYSDNKYPSDDELFGNQNHAFEVKQGRKGARKERQAAKIDETLIKLLKPRKTKVWRPKATLSFKVNREIKDPCRTVRWDPSYYDCEGKPITQLRMYPSDLLGDKTYIQVASLIDDANLNSRLKIQSEKKMRMFDGDVQRIAEFYAASNLGIVNSFDTSKAVSSVITDGTVPLIPKIIQEEKTAILLTSMKERFNKIKDKVKAGFIKANRPDDIFVASPPSSRVPGHEVVQLQDPHAVPSDDVEPDSPVETIVVKDKINPDIELVNFFDVFDEPCVSDGKFEEHNIEAFGSRKLKPRMTKYKFPVLSFAGAWNSSPIGAGPLPFNKHFGLHVRNENYIEIELPSTLIYELKQHWAHVGRDKDYAHFLVTTVKARFLMRFLNIPAKVIADAVLYGPALAYMLSWNEQQNISRIIKRSYWKSWQIKALVGAITVLGTVTITLASLGSIYALIPVFLLPALGISIYTWLQGRSALQPNHIEKLNPTGNQFKEHSVPTHLKKLMQRVAAKFTKDEQDDRDPKLYVIGLGNSNFVPSVKSSTIGNEQRSLEKRVYLEQKPIDAHQAQDYLDWTKDNEDILFGPSHGIQAMPTPVWLQRCNAKKSAKEKYRAALTKLDSEGITSHSYLSYPQRRKFSQLSAFSKPEKECASGLAGTVDKDPRLICGSTAEETVLTGPWISTLQSIMKKRWSYDNSNHVWAAGESANIVASLVEPCDNMLSFDGDYHKFDAHQNETDFKSEQIMLKHFRAPLAIQQLHAENKHKTGYTRCGWKFQVRYQRSSGKTYTSLFNTMINRTKWLYACCKVSELPLVEVLKRSSGVYNGDDNAGRIPNDWPLGNIVKIINDLGADLEVNARPIVEDLEFCSQELWPVVGGYTMAPKVGRLLSKIGFSLVDPKGLSRETFKGVLLSGYDAAYSLPPLRAYYDRMLSLLIDDDSITPEHETHKMLGVRNEPNEETWFHMERKLGWNHDLQESWEKKLSLITDPLQLVDWTEFDLLCDRDCLSGQVYTPANMGVYESGVRLVEARAHNQEQHASNGNTHCAIASWDGTYSTIFDTDCCVRVIIDSTVNPLGFGFANPGTSIFTTLSCINGVLGCSVNGYTFNFSAGQVRIRGPNGIMSMQSYQMYFVPTEDEKVHTQVSPSSVNAPWPSPNSNAAQAAALRHNQVMHANNGNVDIVIDDIDAWFVAYFEETSNMIADYNNVNWLYRVWNKLMHSQNGNQDRSVQAKARIARGVKQRIKSPALSKLDSICRRMGVTNLGKQFVIMAFDPFSDMELQTVGLPDGSDMGVVLQTVNTNITISAPTGQTTPWDCSVVAFPTLGSLATGAPRSTSYTPVTQTGNGTNAAVSVAGSSPGTMLGISYITNNTGTSCDWITGSVTSSGATTIAAKYVNSPMRVVGGGMEIYNTTAELFKGGSIANWSLEMPSIESSSAWLTINTGGTQFGYQSLTPAPAPPNTFQNAIQLARTRGYGAEAGSYIPFTFTDIEQVPRVSNTQSSYLYYDQTALDSLFVGPVTQMITGGGGTFLYSPNNNVTAFNMHGAYFTGLNPNTTLQVYGRYFLATTPSQGDALVTTGKSNFPADPKALQLYSLIMAQLPPGVPVDENGFGSWFANAINWVGGAIESAGNLVGSSFLGTLGKHTKKVGGAIEKVVEVWDKRKDTNKKKFGEKKTIVVTGGGSKVGANAEASGQVITIQP